MSGARHRERERIAVIGSGIAGLACAHVLGPHHDVVLYEADHRLGGHSNTVDVDDPSAGRVPVDTGFIVHNDRNYPNLVRLFAELDVPVFDTEMSFAVTDRDPASPTFGLTYRATSPNTLFADRRNVTRPAMWRMLRDIARFYREANSFLDASATGATAAPLDATAPDVTASDITASDITLRDFLAAGRYSREFVDLHLVPMGAAVWSADPATFAEYPARSLLAFFRNHGLLGVRDRPQWRSIRGGSRRYVTAIAERFTGEIRLGAPVLRVERHGDGPDRRVDVVTRAGRDTFHRVIVAAHSDQALRMLADASPAEREVLGAVRYQPNRATLHTDVSLLSPRRRAWAAWNYDRRPHAVAGAATVTYDLTNLQRLPGSRRYLVSLNSDEHIDPAQVIASFDYAHPFFDRAAVAAQGRFDEIDGVDRVHFCGAWWGHGFHEDGIRSGLRVCERLGVRWPVPTVVPDTTTAPVAPPLARIDEREELV